MKRETLFLRPSLTGDVWFLEDSRKALVGRFNTEAEARKWAEEFGYNVRKT